MVEKETKSCSEECEEMKDNEIIKALEVCAYSDACLKECPLFNYKADCIRMLTASALEIIKRYQSDVEPVRHAKWQLIDECVNEGVYCSNCHKKVYRTEYANQKVKSNYCPNCGAKMDGGEEND